jgi:protein arginine kinase activator
VVKEAVLHQRACSTCGTLLSEVVEGHRVGCARCYESFGSQIESILYGLHRALRHKGKAFRVDDTRARVRSDLETKRALLRTVLDAENYEEAAALRDEIRCLEEGLYAFDSGVD